MAAAMRAALYLRQSIAREDSISLELQEAACRAHCERRGYDVVMVEADPGISGRTFNRPAVRRVMQAVEDRGVDVVVLWKWSRLSRSRRDWAVAADAVDVAGGRIESATEDIDVSTSHGRLARGMLVEFAAFESERIGDQWKEAHARRVRKGLPATGKPRFGYRRAGEGFEPDPETGPLLAELYRRYIAGESAYQLVKWLNDQGSRTVAGYGTSGGDWSRRSVQRMLDSGFGAGLIRYHGELLPGVHEPVITAEEWEDYQAARRRRAITRGSERSQYLLSGLVRCSCGATMNAGQFGWQRAPKYRCKAAQEKRTHTGGYVMAGVLETAVLDWMRGLVADLTAATNTTVEIEAKRERTQLNVGRLHAEVTAAEQSITRLTVQYAEGKIPEIAYTSALPELETKRDRLLARITAAEAEARTLPASVEQVSDLLAVWDILGVEQRREALRGLISHVKVFPGRPKSRVEVIPAWTG